MASAVGVGFSGTNDLPNNRGVGVGFSGLSESFNLSAIGIGSSQVNEIPNSSLIGVGSSSYAETFSSSIGVGPGISVFAEIPEHTVIVAGWEVTKKLISVAVETVDPLYIPYRMRTSSSTINFAPRGNLNLAPTSGNVTVDANTISLMAYSASNFSASGADLTLLVEAYDVNLTTLNSGNVALSSVADVDIDSSTSSTISVDGPTISVGLTPTSLTTNIGTGTNAKTINIANATGATLVNIDSGSGGLDVDTPASINLDSSQASSSAIVLATGVSGGVTITGGTPGIDVDSTGSINITSLKDDASAVVITASAASAGVDIDAVYEVTLDAGTVNISTGSGTVVNIGTG